MPANTNTLLMHKTVCEMFTAIDGFVRDICRFNWVRLFCYDEIMRPRAVCERNKVTRDYDAIPALHETSNALASHCWISASGA